VFGWCFPCSNYKNDGNDYVYIVIQNDEKDIATAYKAIGLDDLAANPEYNNRDGRDRHKDELYTRIGAWTISRTKQQVMDTLAPLGIPCAPVLSMKEIANDASLRATKAIVEIDQGGLVGKFLTVGCPFTISDYEPNYGPCPTLGGNTDEVLAALGYTAQQLAQFKANGTTAPLK
jgi:formyl-CoA transferase